MLEYEEVKEAIDKGYIKGDRVSVVRIKGKLVDYVLPGEPIKPWEVVTVELLVDVLEELLEYQQLDACCGSRMFWFDKENEHSPN